MNTEMNREQLIADYAQQIMDGMDMKTMECFVYDTLVENLSAYSDEQLIEEVTEYNPELLQSAWFSTVSNGPSMRLRRMA